jgi:hypothetical protein
MKLLNKRAQVGNLSGFFMGIGVASIVLVVMMLILTQLQTSAEQSGCIGTNYWNATSSQCEFNATTVGRVGTSAANATSNILVKLGTAPTWIGLIILAGLAFIVLGFFMGRRGQ